MAALSTPGHAAGVKINPLLGLLIFMLAIPAPAEIHQWRDAQGRLHFSDKAPEQADSKTVNIDVRSPNRQDVIVFQRQEFKLSAENEALVRQALPEIVALYQQQLGLDVRNNVTVNLHLLESKAAFDLWLKARIGNARRPSASGIYITGTREVAVWKWSTNEADVVRTILHESSHVILAQLASNVPRWLHEGLAEYVEQLQLTDKGMRVNLNQQAVSRLRQWITTEELISLRNYLSLSEQQWQNLMHESSSIPYTVAWATVYFMLSRPTGRQTLRQILHRLEKNNERPDAALLDSLYPGGLTNMDYDFFRWAQQDSIAAHHYND